MTPPQPTDDDAARLVQRCLAGDEEAERELIDSYAGLCYSIASRVLDAPDRSYVEDAVQEALYAVFAKLSQWRGRNLAAWIGTIAARRAIDLRRRLRRARIATSHLEASELAARPASHGTSGQSELRDAIAAARERLTDRQRRVLDALVNGGSRAEIAEELGVSARTVYYELAEIRRQFRDLLGALADPGGGERL